MKAACSLFVFALLSSSALGQSSAPSQQEAKSQQPVQIQMECREASADKTLAPDETLINGLACKPVKRAAAPRQMESAAASAPDPKAPKVEASTSAAPHAEATPDSKKDSAPLAIRQCLLLKRMGPADEITSRLYSFGIRGKQFQYVEGEFPKGLKFHGRLTDNDVRKIQEHKGKVVILEPGYTADTLKAAKESCKQE